MVIGNRKEQLQGALKYVVLNLLSSALFLIGAGLIYGKIGTLNMADITRALIESPDADLISSSGVLLFVAFGIKAGVFPLCFWLPASYHTPPASVSALFAGIMTKVGVYAMFRGMTLFLSPATDELQPIMLGVAMATMVMGVLGAVGQYNIRMILSIHIISQVGYILAGFTMLTVASVSAGIYYLVHNIVVKANLFLMGGVVRRVNGSDHLLKTGGMIKLYPVFSTAFFITAFSLAGLPPLSGFWAKFSLLSSAISSKSYWTSFFIVGVSLFTLLSMIKIWIGAFWPSLPQPSREDESVDLIKDGQSPMTLWVPCLILAMSSLVMGLFGAPLFDYAMATAEDVLDPSRYIQAVLGKGS
jgi:multicomponent Na+:H+ antiporter subunit D